MRKFLFSIILSLVVLVPLALVATPALAQDSTTTSWDSYYDDTYDYNWDYGYDNTTVPAEVTFASILGLLFGGVALVFSIVIGLGSYIYTSLALMKIAKRLNYENAWYAWVPILNIILMFKMGDQNPTLLLLLLIPGIGAAIVGILSIIALMHICEKRGYDKALGLLSLVPLANYVLLGMLAWGKKENVAVAA